MGRKSVLSFGQNTDPISTSVRQKLMESSSLIHGNENQRRIERKRAE
jgi:hypothetical protein